MRKYKPINPWIAKDALCVAGIAGTIAAVVIYVLLYLSNNVPDPFTVMHTQDKARLIESKEVDKGDGDAEKYNK